MTTDGSPHRDIYKHFVDNPACKTFCLMVITGMVQALLLLCVAIDYKSKWSSRWLAIAAGSMLSDNPQLLFALALCKVASLAALMYYVHNEALAAVALIQVVATRRAVCTGSEEGRNSKHSSLLVLVPLWQLLLAVGTFFLQSFIFCGYYLPAGYGSLTINQDSALISDVVFAAVALSFVLELDNKALEMLRRTPETFALTSMYSVIFKGGVRSARQVLPMDSSRNTGNTMQRSDVVNLFSVLWNKLTKGHNTRVLADVLYAFTVTVFHILVMLYTYTTMHFLTAYAYDVFPTFVPSPSQVIRVIAVVVIATTIFLGFQLVLGIWLPPPPACTAACESACTRAGRPHVPSQCRIYRWYALAGNIIVPIVSAVVSMVTHNVANVNAYNILAASGVDCEHIVSEQLRRTGGPNVSCGNTEVDMVSYVSDLAANSSKGTGIQSFELCSIFGIRNINYCSSLWYIGIPFSLWAVACTVLVLFPLLFSMMWQRPCRGCRPGMAGQHAVMPTVSGSTAVQGCSTSTSFASAIDALPAGGSVFANKDVGQLGDSTSL